MVQILAVCIINKGKATVAPTKSDSDRILCVQLLTKNLT